MTNSFTLPRSNQVVPLAKAMGSTIDIKPTLEAHFKDDAVIEQIEPYLIGNVEGKGTDKSRYLDIDRVLTIIINRDTEKGGVLHKCPMNTCDMIEQLMVVIRRHYILGDGTKEKGGPACRGKAIAVNRQRYLLLEDSLITA